MVRSEGCRERTPRDSARLGWTRLECLAVLGMVEVSTAVVAEASTGVASAWAEEAPARAVEAVVAA